MGEKKIKEGKGEKYLEKEKNFFFRRRITEKEKEDNVWRRKIFFCEKKEKEEIFGKGKYFFSKEKEENIWRRKISFVKEKKRRKIFGEGFL